MALLLERLPSERMDPHCRLCPAWRGAKTVCVASRGSGKQGRWPAPPVDVLFVGEMPGYAEDLHGKSFIGPTGAVFDEFVAAFMGKRKWVVTNGTKCYLGNKAYGRGEAVKPDWGSRDDPGNLQLCRRHLDREIRFLKPKLIVPMGAYAVSSVLGVQPKDVKMYRLLQIPLETEWGIKAYPVNHPATILHQGLDADGDNAMVWKLEAQWQGMVDFLDGKGQSLPGHWIWTEDPEQVERYYSDALGQARVCFDYETFGLDAKDPESRFRMVGVSWDGDFTFVHPMRDGMLETHTEFLREYEGELVVQNFRMELSWALEKLGFIPDATVLDTKVLHFLVDENAGHDLESLVDQYASEFSGFKRATEAIGVDQASDRQVAERCAYDCMAEWRLSHTFQGVLSEKAKRTYVEIIEPGMKSLVRCWHRGWKVHRRRMQVLLEGAKRALEAVYDRAILTPEVKAYEDGLNPEHTVTGRKRTAKRKRFNLGSDKMVPEMMKILQLDTGAGEKGDYQSARSGYLRTAAEVMEKFRGLHPFVGHVLEWSEIRGTIGYFLKPLLETSARDGFCHPNYNLGGKDREGEGGGTVSLRPSCAKPNLLNLPRDDQDANPWIKGVRHCFVSRFEGGRILGADLSQAELRMMAVLSGEEAMLAEYRKSKPDLHQLTAGRMGLSRDLAKTFNFAQSYEAGVDRLVRECKSNGYDVSVEQVGAFLRDFKESYPQLFVWKAKVKGEAFTQGYVESRWGVRLRCPDIYDPRTVDHAGRRVVNWHVQHAVAMIVLEAMGVVERLYEEECLRSVLIGQLYDALWTDVHPDDDLERIKEINDYALRELPQEKYKGWLDVPLAVDFKAGRTMAG